MESIKKIFLFALCMFCFIGCGKTSEEEILFTENTVVHIQSENLQGSGIIYNVWQEQIVVATAAHVVKNAQEVWIGSQKVSHVYSVEGLDLVFLVVEDVNTMEGVKLTHSHTDQAADRQDLILRGYDSTGNYVEISGKLKENWIYVEDFQCHMMIAEADATPGMSGGGVFDQNGVFLGIICGIDQDGNVAILPASVIASEYAVLFDDLP